MADIELVIKISEEECINIKNAINSLIGNGVESSSMSKVCLAILDGTPLPKGHGRLIDADALIDTLGCSDRDIYVKACIEEDAPTIIEANKESEVER
jgi:hypothetical protein